MTSESTSETKGKTFEEMQVYWQAKITAARQVDWRGWTKEMTVHGRTTHTYRVTKPASLMTWPEAVSIALWCDTFTPNFGCTLNILNDNAATITIYVD